MADILETARKLEEQERATAARQALTPPDEFPTADFTGAPATVDAVLRTADPTRYRGEFEQMNFLEKGMNAVGAGVQNYQKAEAMEDVIDTSISAKGGLASRFGGDIESESDDPEVQKILSGAITGTRSDIAYKKEMADKQEKAINEYLRLTAYDEDYKTPEVVTRASQATEGKGFFDSIGAYVSEVAKDPLNYAIYLTGSSLGAIAPSLAMSMVGGGILSRGFKLGRTAQAFQSAMMGYGSYNVEFGSYLQNYLQEKGYDLTSADSIRQAMANEDLETLTKRAQMRGIAVGMFDAFSAWVAPIRLNPSNALRYLRRAKDAVPTKMVPTSRLYNFGKGAENLAMQTTLQGVLGGAGEAFGQLVNGEQVNWGDVFAEAFGEFTSAPVEVIGLATSANAKFNADSEYCKNANKFNETAKQVTQAVQAVSQTMKEGETLQQWAQKVGEGTPLFAYAQDLVEQGISEKIRETNPELADKIEEAARQKTDITLSMGDVLTLATKDESLAQSVVNESRIDADGMSPRQAQEFLKNGKEEAAKKFQEIVDKVKPDVERRKEIKTVVDKLRDDLVAQGMTKELADASTMPWTAKLAVLCKQLNTTAEDVMNRLNLQVKRQQAEQQQKVEALQTLMQEVSTALPSDSAIKRGVYIDPSYVRQWASYDEAKKNPEWLKSATDSVKELSGIKGALKGADDANADAVGEKIIEHLMSNLLWLYNKMPADLRNRAKLWYDGGRKTAVVWANRYGLRTRQTAAIIAIFSPQNGWFNNMTNAERLLDIYFSVRRQKADQAMLDWYKGYCEKKENKGKGLSVEDIEGKSLEDLLGAKEFYKAGLWVRAYNIVHNDGGYNALSPEGGVVGRIKNSDGKEASSYFMRTDTIGKALSVIVDGSVDNIDKQIGNDFKVRNFYNNLYNPINPYTATIDTHAVGAALLHVVSSTDEAVDKNFGSIGNATSGQKGTYPIYFEAYRRAAEKLGVLPRELQSITWEAVRVLFESSKKDEMRPVVDGIWKQFDEGKISADEARRKVFRKAKGFGKLAWEDSEFNNQVTETYDRSNVKLYDDITQPLPEPTLALEIRPDANNKELSAQWKKLSKEDRQSISQEMIPWIVERVALLTQTHISLPMLTRVSSNGRSHDLMSCEIEDGKNAVEIARILATLLHQKEVSVTGIANGEGVKPCKILRIEIPMGFTKGKLAKLYSSIDALKGKDGKRLVANHSTASGTLMLSVEPNKIDEVESALDAVIPLKWDIEDGYTGSFNPYSVDQTRVETEKERANAKNVTRRGKRIQKAESPANLHILYAQSNERLEALIRGRSKDQGRQQGQQQSADSLAQVSPLAQSLYQSATGNRNRSDIDWVAEQRYMEAVQNGDMETARRMVAEKAVRMGYMNPIPEETKGWKLRTKPAPKKTIKAYKVFFVNDKGEPTTLFVGDSQPVPRGVWLDAQEGYSIVNPKNGRRYVPTFSNPNRQTADGKKKTGKTGETVPIADEQTRQELIDRGFITDKATSVTAVANRPGFHAGTLPYFPQGGERRVGSNYGNVHEPRQVVFEVELSADTDYTETARNQEKARTKDGRVNARNADLDYLPEDGMYRYTTNPMLDPAEDGWVISGSMKIVRALSQEECDKILAEHGKAPQEWSQGEMELDSLGITNPEMSEANRKTLAPVTYDASGNVIPLFMRFNPAIDNVLYQINPSQLQSLLQLAFHGSPYWFEAFSTKNIGSGEGAQAHGWGLYFALNKAVAEAYKKRLNKGEMSVTYKGRPISELEQKLDDEFDAWERKRPLHGGPADGLTDEYIAWSNKYWELHGKRKFIYRLSAPWFDTQEELGYLQGESKDWARDEILPYVERREGATLYTVDIPEDDVMLREELPFEDQPPKVQEALKKLFPEQYSKEKAETERAAWLEEVKNSQAIKDAFWKMPETYKAFIALAEKEGPQAFADIATLMKKLKTASKKDAKVARDANLQNGVDESLEEVEEDLWSELGNSKLMYPYELANSDKYANLFAYAKSAEAREKNRKAWLTAFRKVIRSIEDEGELMDNTAEGLKKLAKKEGPSIFLDEARLFDKMLPYLRKDAEETFEDEKEDRGENFTLDDWAEELFYNLRDIGNLGHLQDCASKYQVKGEGLRLQGVKGERIYDQLARSLGSEMKASILLSKYGIQGIRYYGYRDGECAVVFDDAMIKIIETLQQLAYHGTGFNDPILKFSLDHVGEGEGAQAHGYGLYFALAKAVAQGYRDKLTNGQYRIGKTDSNEYRTELEAKVKKAKGKDKQKWIDRLTAFDEWHGHKNMDAVKEAHDNGEITDDAFNWFEKEIRPNVQTDGGLYLVDIPEDYEMLDEMLQFEAQPEQVKAALRKLVKNEFSPEQLTKLYKEQWYRDAMYQMEDYSYTFDVPDVVLRALDELAQEEGPRIFAHEKKVLAKISDALNEAAEEKYLEDQEYYDEQAHGRKKGIDIARDEIIEEGGLNKDGLFWTLHNVAEENYPSLLKGKVKFEFTDSLHGFQIYNQIAEFVGGKKEASALLNKYGIKGIRYNGLDDGECAVVWDEESIKIQERLAQVKAQLESVAAQSARGDFVPNNTATRGNGMGGLMTLMQNADKSTFMHESAHAWLDLDTMLACDIAEKMERGEELTEGEIAFMKNLGGFFRWGQQEGKIDLGVTDDIATVATAVKRWSQMTVHQQRGMHELFAEGFEAYLYEGVAPNKEMQSIFSRFKAWLKELYQRINYTPMVLSPEVRKLYDLMFASEQQAQDTETRMGFRALITAEMGDKLGMTPEELEAYNRLAEQATLETEGLVAKSVHGAMRIFGNLRKGEAERMEREHKEDIEQTEETILAEPRYVAVSLLTDGRYEERDGVMVHTPPVKLMHDDLVNFGIPNDTVLLLAERGWVEAEGTIQMERPHQLEREKAEGFDEVTAGPYRVDGVPIQMFATMCGSDNPIELIGDILEIKSLDDAHKEAVKSVAYKEREEMGENPDKFRELQANLCAYNETRSRLLTAEYNAIARKLGSQQMLVSAARDYAQEQIGNIPVNKLRPKSYMAAERRNIKEAEEAFRKGDFQKALEAKRAQIVNHEMARAAMEAQDRYNKGVNVAKRALKSKTVHPQFKRVVDALLSMHSVKAMTEKEREEFKLGEPLTQDKIDEFVKTLEDNGTPVDGLKGFLGSRTPAVEMTVNESRDFFEIVKEVTALGRNLLMQNLTEERERITDICDKAEVHLSEAADAQNRPIDPHQHVAHTEKQRRHKSLSDFLLSHTKIATWFRIFDQNKAGGFFWNLFIRSANRCANFENEQRAKSAQYLADKFATVFKKNMEEDPVIIDGFAEPFTHGMRLAVALNWGNESNRERLTTNDPRFTPDAIQAIFEHLTEADWRAVEAVWQLFESFRPMIEEKELRVRGIAPEWIEYSPFEVTTAEGKKITVSGGYYPVKYDPEASNSADKYTSADDVEQEMKGAYQSATTRESFIKSRVKGKVTNMPLRLDLNPLYEGLNDVIHDLAWHEWLIDTKKVLDGVPGVQRGLREVIKERYGSQVTREIEMWRTDIAVGGRNPASVTWAAKLASCIGVSTMGYSLTSAVVQLTGMGYVIPRVGVNAFLVGLAKYMSNPFKASKMIREKSKAMNLRNMTQFKEISQIRNRLEQGHGVKTWLHDHAYVLISLVQSIADSVCWLSAYEKYSREETSEAKLIAMCDQVVIDTQSSGNINDLSRVERDRAGLSRLFTIFYSWMNAALNLAVGEYLGETSKFKKTANLLFMCAVMPVVEKAFRDSLTGKDDDDDDDDEDPLKTYVREPLSAIAEYNLGLFTGLTRECASAASNFISGDRIYGYSGPAGVRLMAHANNAFSVASNPNEKKVMKAIIDLLGDLRGIPSVQINRTIKGIRAVNSGQAEGIDAIKAPLFGYKGRVYD